jgi:hypothetical protein
MGAIFPMAPLSTRMGFVKKREKDARRSAQRAHRDRVPFPDLQARRSPLFLDKPVAPPSPLQRHNHRRKREAKQKAETLRSNGDMAVFAAVKDLQKSIRSSVALIEKIPKDERGRLRIHDIIKGVDERKFSRKASSAFRFFTSKERRALSSAAGKYRAAAKRLSVSVTAARNLWEATLAEYKRVELVGSKTKAGGLL